MADVIPVELVVIEPPPAVVEAPPAPPKKITLPKPIATPLPKLAEAPKPEPKQDPKPVSPAPALVAPSVQLPVTAPSAASTRTSDQGVSLVESAPQRSTVASVPSDAAVSRVAQPKGGYQVRPRYPSTAQRAGIQGTTMLRVHVLEDGRVGEINVEESAGHPDLDEAATDAVRRWRFEPARRGEQAVAMWVRLPVEFRLK